MDRRENQKIRNKERYEKLKSKGICARCGKEKAVPGFVKCEACRMALQVYNSGRAKRNGYNTLPFNNKTTDTLDGIYEEVTKYNEEHGTNYSYGYYSALKFRGLI